MVGIAIIFWDQLNAKAPILPMLAVVIGAVCLAESTVLFKIVPKSHPITTNAVAMAVGAVILFLASTIWGETMLMSKVPSTWIPPTKARVRSAARRSYAVRHAMDTQYTPIWPRFSRADGVKPNCLYA